MDRNPEQAALLVPVTLTQQKEGFLLFLHHSSTLTTPCLVAIGVSQTLRFRTCVLKFGGVHPPAASCSGLSFSSSTKGRRSTCTCGLGNVSPRCP